MMKKLRLIAEAGFQSIDFWGWRDKNIPKLAAACREYQVKVVNFNGHRQGSMVASQTHPVLIQDVKDTISDCPATELSIPDGNHEPAQSG